MSEVSQAFAILQARVFQEMTATVAVPLSAFKAGDSHYINIPQIRYLAFVRVRAGMPIATQFPTTISYLGHSTALVNHWNVSRRPQHEVLIQILTLVHPIARSIWNGDPDSAVWFLPQVVAPSRPAISAELTYCSPLPKQ